MESSCLWSDAALLVGAKKLRERRLNPDFPGAHSATIGAMTTIIGVQGKEGCLLAADSRTTGETGRPYCHEFVEKITERGPYMIACSGDADACDIIQHQWNPPKPPKLAKSHYKFMVTEISTSLKHPKRREEIMDQVAAGMMLVMVGVVIGYGFGLGILKLDNKKQDKVDE